MKNYLRLILSVRFSFLFIFEDLGIAARSGGSMVIRQRDPEIISMARTVVRTYVNGHTLTGVHSDDSLLYTTGFITFRIPRKVMMADLEYSEHHKPLFNLIVIPPLCTAATPALLLLVFFLHLTANHFASYGGKCVPPFSFPDLQIPSTLQPHPHP